MVSSKPQSWPDTSSASSVLGWNSPKWPMTSFGTHLDRARPAGMVPGRPARLDLQVGGGEAAGFEHRQRIGLGVEDIDRAGRRPCPGSTRAGPGRRSRRCATDAAGNPALAVRTVALVSARHFEDRHIAIAAVGIALGRSQSPGRSEGRMSLMSAAIGLTSFSSGLPPPKSSAWAAGMKDQVTASSIPREARARLAIRVRICSVVRILPLTVLCAAGPPAGRGRHRGCA